MGYNVSTLLLCVVIDVTCIPLFSAPLAAAGYQVTHFINSSMLKFSWVLTDSHLMFSDTIYLEINLGAIKPSGKKW